MRREQCSQSSGAGCFETLTLCSIFGQLPVFDWNQLLFEPQIDQLVLPPSFVIDAVENANHFYWSEHFSIFGMNKLGRQLMGTEGKELEEGEGEGETVGAT